MDIKDFALGDHRQLDMTTEQAIRDYQRRCHEGYSSSVGLPKDYRYPTGSAICPVPPVQTRLGGLMIIGAYPSARFESRPSPNTGRRRLIPIADNLQPFGTEVYFDGTQVRRLESAAGLRTYLLDPLSLTLEDCWITDLVKVFLYKPEHRDSCADAVPGFQAPVLRDHFMELAERSLAWIKEEHDLCCPRVVVTLGDEVGRALTKSRLPADELLTAHPQNSELLGGRSIFCCPHPDACRRMDKWVTRMATTVDFIRQELERSPKVERVHTSP